MPREPAVRGVPPDDRSAPVSAVWVGHATVLLRIGSKTVLTDPNLSGSILIAPRITQPSLTAEELPPVDVVLLSHPHMDHFDAPTLRKLGEGPTVLTPKGFEKYFDEIDQPDKRTVATWQTVEVAGLKITAVPARHRGGRFGFDFVTNKAYTGWIIQGAGRTLFFAGDTGWDEQIFREIGRRFPGIDLAMIPIAPSRRAPEDKRPDSWGHVSPEQALDVLEAVGAKAMLPIHHEAYYASSGRIDEPMQRLKTDAAKRGLSGKLLPLHTGERVVLTQAGGFDVYDAPRVAQLRAERRRVLAQRAQEKQLARAGGSVPPTSTAAP